MKEKLEVIEKEMLDEENKILNLSASYNYLSKDALDELGSFFANCNAKGYVNERKSDGANKVELLAIDAAKKVFSVNYANVQSYSLINATKAVCNALLNNGDKILTFGLASDEHINHEMGYNTSFYKYATYNVEKETGQLNYDDVKKIAIIERPKMIMVNSFSYSRLIDFEELKVIAKMVKAYLVVNMDHISGLVACGIYPSPCKWADVCITSTNKTLNGPMGALILTNSESINSKIEKSLYPGLQGASYLNFTASMAVCLSNCLTDSFKDYQKQTLKNAKILCDVLKMEKIKVIANGTDNHLLLIDVKGSLNMTGKEAENILNKVGIIANKALIPEDPTTPFITSGIKLGTASLTKRGLKEKEFIEIGKIISMALKNSEDNDVLKALRQRVEELSKSYPISKEGVSYE